MTSHGQRRRIGKDARGAATIEFAFWAVLIFAALIPGMEMANYLIAANRLSAATGQGSVLAYNMRSAETIDTAKLSRYVNAAAGLPGAAVATTISCNGGTQSCAVPVASRQCSCVSATLPVTYGAASSCDATCANGAAPGFYLTIDARYPYRAVIVGDRWLDGREMKRAVTVRLS